MTEAGQGAAGGAVKPASGWDSAAATEGEGELFLQFPIPSVGLCALPIEAVQTVAEAGGPFRRVPGRGGVGKRFLGLVPVRGQVHLLFDLSLPQVGAPATALASGEHLVVAVAADGRTLALRVGAELRLVRCLPQAEVSRPRSAEFAPLVYACFYPAKRAESVEPVWLLDAGRLFALLEREVAHG